MYICEMLMSMWLNWELRLILPMRCQNLVKVRSLKVGINRPTPRLGGRCDVKMRLRVLGALQDYTRLRQPCLARARASRWEARSGRHVDRHLAGEHCRRLRRVKRISDPIVLALFTTTQAHSMRFSHASQALPWTRPLHHSRCPRPHGAISSSSVAVNSRLTGTPRGTSKFCIRDLKECRDPYTFLYSALGHQTCSQCCAEPHVRQRSDRNGVPVPDVEMHLCNLRSSPGAL